MFFAENTTLDVHVFKSNGHVCRTASVHKAEIVSFFIEILIKNGAPGPLGPIFMAQL